MTSPEELDVEAILWSLRTENEKRRKRRRIVRNVYLSVVACAYAWVLFHLRFQFILNLLNVMNMYIACLWAASKSQKDASRAIARLDDIRAVGPLAEALDFKDEKLYPIATEALCRLLPRLKASDASLLDRGHRVCLNNAMAIAKPELVLAILKAWEQVGDETSIPVVQKLADGKGRAAENKTIAEAARECLPYLLQSAERQKIASQLLRPSQETSPGAEVLLRPAMPQASTQSLEQLLRSSESGS